MALRVLDTDVWSYFFKGHHTAARYQPHVQGHTLAVSFMTVAELYEWALHARWGIARLHRMELELRGYVTVPSSPDLCRVWAAIRFERRGRPISAADGWIAATALFLGCPLLTHNAADFQGIRALTGVTEASP